MGYNVRFRCNYYIDYANNMISISGVKSDFNNDGEIIGRVPMNISLTLDTFLEICTVCIASKQNTDESIILSDYGISYRRETFDDRYFYCGELQLSQGEIYILYEIIKKRIDPEKFKMYKFFNNLLYPYFFLHKDGYIIISNKSMSSVGFFRSSLFSTVDFSAGDKLKSGQMGFNKEVNIGNIQTAHMEHGACHPYVVLTYRDMAVSMSLDEWKALREFCIDFTWQKEDW